MSCEFHYGAGNVWESTWVSGLSVVECTNEQFGDPFIGTGYHLQSTDYYIQGPGRHCCRGQCIDPHTIPNAPCFSQFC